MKLLGSITSASYGRVEKSYDQHPRYRFVEANCKDVSLLKELLSDCDHFVASAAMIGGISYFHEFAYDLLAENERITAASFDAAIHAHQHQKLQKITVMSSSMVFEHPRSIPLPKAPSIAVRLRVRRTDFRSWRPSILFRARGSSTSCPTPLCARLIASALEEAGVA